MFFCFLFSDGWKMSYPLDSKGNTFSKKAHCTCLAFTTHLRELVWLHISEVSSTSYGS